MKESAHAAWSYVRSKAKILDLPKDFYKKKDVHIHVPEGGIPKDGPSAGITMATTIVSAFTHIPVRNDLAMTGEITLQGRVLPIGGLKEKLLAAHRSKISKVIIPQENKKDLSEIPLKIKKALKIILVENMDEVLKIALVSNPFENIKNKDNVNLPPKSAIKIAHKQVHKTVPLN
jgi:ATP-dependent Lon protease